MDRLRHLLHDDTGASATVVAIFFIAALLMAAVVVDAGYLYDARRQLQAAADAGALAGCQELIQTDDPGAATALAEEYALQNASGAGTGLVVDGVTVDMGEYSVRVAVSRQTPVFFARILGPNVRRVVAVAKARKWQLSGGRYLVPWAIPIIRNVDRVEAWVDGGSPTVLASAGALHWSGSVPAPAAGASADVFVRVYNTYGVAEQLVESSGSKTEDAPVARVTGFDPAGGLASIGLSDDFLSSSGAGRYFPVTLTVRTNEPQTEVRAVIGKGGGYDMAGSEGGLEWTLSISAGMVPFGDDPVTVVPVYISAGTAGAGKSPDAYIHVRRTTTPFENVVVSPMVQEPGGPIGVDVWLNDFDPSVAQPGAIYTLRVNSNGNLGGNFGELNFNKIDHDGCPPDAPGLKPGVNYFDNVALGYKGGVHVGDIIEMSPGASGANTDRALNERASTLEPGEDMIIAVPVVEKYEDKGNGAYDVIVVAFASFRIVSYGDGDVEGEFIEYIANPSEYEPDPEGGPPGGISAPRLVNP